MALVQRIAAELAGERDGGAREYEGERDEHRAPAEMVADNAAENLPRDHAAHLAGQKSRQHRLPPCIGHHVADIGHAERHDDGGARRRDEAGERELRHRLRDGAQQHQQAGHRAGRRHRLAFAEPVAEHAGEDLRAAVGDGVSRDDRGGGAQARGEILRHLRQQRVGDAQRGAAGKGRERHQDNDAGQRAVGGGGGGGQVDSR